jgi:hypothetical protein
MEERDPRVRADHNARLTKVCADPELAHGYALEASMIRSLRDSGQLPVRDTVSAAGHQ